jgi:hypothetical protein
MISSLRTQLLGREEKELKKCRAEKTEIKMHCTNCGQQNDRDATFCINCGNPIQDDSKQKFPDTGSGELTSSYNSGQGKMTALPAELSGWNWGAFFLSWIWGIGNNTWIAFLTFIPFVNFVMIFVLGAKGNEWAWQNKKWNNFEHFKRVQKLWAIWGLILFLIGILFMFLVIIAALSVADTYDY